MLQNIDFVTDGPISIKLYVTVITRFYAIYKTAIFHIETIYGDLPNSYFKCLGKYFVGFTEKLLDVVSLKW